MAFEIKSNIAEFYKNDARLVQKKNNIAKDQIGNGDSNNDWNKTSIIDLDQKKITSHQPETFSDRLQRDIGLIGDFMSSHDGKVFNTKQQGLHLTDPNLYKTDMNKKYNPASILQATATAYTGLRPVRQGYNIFKGFDYESFIKDLNNNGQNRLVDLTHEIIYNKNKKEGDLIETLSDITGPKSFFGAGRTDITLHSSTFKLNEEFTPRLDSLNEKINDPDNKEHETNMEIPGVEVEEFGNLYESENEIKEKVDNEVKAPKSTVKDIGNPNQYSVLAHDQLERDGEFEDFRNKLNSEEITGEGYKNEDAIVNRFGMIDPAKNTDKSDIKKSSQKDKINILKENEENENVDDFVKFKIRDVNNESQFVIFRSTFTSINDDISPSWDSDNIPGRADAIYRYTSYERTFSLDFMVPTYSRNELMSNYRRLNRLGKFALPIYDEGKGFRSPFIRFTIGDYYSDTPGFISSLNFQVDDNTTWEINLENDDNIGQLPKHINVSMTCTVINDVVPSQRMNFFSILDNIV